MGSSAQRFSIRLITNSAIAFALFTQGHAAKAQTVYICDTTNNSGNACTGEAPGGINYGTPEPYNVGDSWTLTIYTYAYAPIDACSQAGCTSGGAFGNANAYGDFILYGQFSSNDVGNWWETWYAGPYPSDPTNTIYFQVTGNGSGGGPGGGSNPSCGVSVQPQPPSVIFASATYNFDAASDSYIPTDESSNASYVQASTQTGCTLTASAGSGGSFGPFGTSPSGQNTANMYYGVAAADGAYTPPSGIMPDGWCGTIATYYLNVSFTASGANFSSSTGSANFEMDVSGCFYNF